ncbi:MAG: thioredoxin family protein [Alkalispirochaeta sp.]|jgi:thioredoxin-like negative regulator of GroEL
MTEITSLEELGEAIATKPFVLVYFSRPDCGVCTALKPKVTQLVSTLPEAVAYYVNLDVFPQAAGMHSIFTIPGIVVFVDGKESIREARYVSAADLQEKMDRLYRLRFP